MIEHSKKITLLSKKDSNGFNCPFERKQLLLSLNLNSVVFKQLPLTVKQLTTFVSNTFFSMQ